MKIIQRSNAKKDTIDTEALSQNKDLGLRQEVETLMDKYLQGGY